MFKKASKIIFTVLFLGMLILPLLATNLHDGKISVTENRVLASKPHIFDQDGTLNGNITSDFETWINDNIGFRSQMVGANAKMQYYVFNNIADNNMYLGPGGELNYATNDIIKDYQHKNLKSSENLSDIAEDYQTINDYLEDKGIQLYYFQCWDKHSIYPEQFPESVIQYGNTSKTDQIVAALENDTTINVVSPKQALTDAKTQYNTYGVWNDPTHWTQRGARIGYRMLMEKINSNNSGKYKVLYDDDYDIIDADFGKRLMGGIYKPDWEELFTIKDPKAYKTDESPIHNRMGANCSKILQNDSVDNNDTLLIIGDSYIEGFLYNDFGESFHRVVMIWGDYGYDLIKMIDNYNPQIVIIENAERCERTAQATAAAKSIKELSSN